ncbi:pyridoxal-dependent decarboxylase, partial [Xanthomonas citri pv. citri]
NEIIRNAQSAVTHTSLDPQDWSEFRALAHRMLDEAIDGIANVRARPVWQPIPDDVRAAMKAEVPREASDLAEVYREFSEHVAPYATGNVHPGFMGWVHGGGTAVGMLAEMLAAGLNANLGGRDHMPIEVERQIVAWMRDLFAFPESASGIFVTGTS